MCDVICWNWSTVWYECCRTICER